MIPMNLISLRRSLSAAAGASLARQAPRLQVLVLAAGFSSRLGRPKPLARVRAFSLLRRTLLVVERFAPAKIIVVIPSHAARYRIEARGVNVVFAANPQRADGLSSSVRRGIVLARYSSALLLLPVDLADLQPRDLARLISRWRAARRCVIARRIGQQGAAARGGVPLILPRWLYSRALEVTGDIGLRDLIGRLPPPQRVLLNLPSAALDVDTPQDLHAARRRLRSSGVSF
jgi:molybdenum cofactor cytidylyltransferase